jgi:GT2 family glycosyltransferase
MVWNPLQRFRSSPARDKGDFARDRGDWESAVDYYRVHLAKRPKDFDIWVQCGHGNKELGQYSEALECYSRARALKPSDSDNLLSIGHLYKRMGLPLLAKDFYERSLAADGNQHAADELVSIKQLILAEPERDMKPLSGQDAVDLHPDLLNMQATGLDLMYARDAKLDARSDELILSSFDPWLVFSPADKTANIAIFVVECDPTADKLLNQQIFVDYGSGFRESRSIAFRTVDGVAKIVIPGLQHVRAIRWDPSLVPLRIKPPKLSLVSLLSPTDEVLDGALSALPTKRCDELKQLMEELIAQPTPMAEDAADLFTRMLLFATDYELWIDRNENLKSEDYRLITRMDESLATRPRFSFVIPTYNTPEHFLRECLDSLLAQTYPDFEICVADDNSPNARVWSTLVEYAGRDQRVKITRRQHNGMISNASNSALALATGDFIVLVDHDDIIPNYTLSVVAWYINQHPEGEIFFSDEDKISFGGVRCEPYFKSHFNRFMMYGHNMFSHLGVYRRELVEAIGGFRSGVDGSQDYDLTFRCLEACGEEKIVHIPHVLYHWRMSPGSTAVSADQKDYAFVAAKSVINGHFERTGMPLRCVDGVAPGISAIRPTREFNTSVSIIIPTRNGADLVEACLSSIFKRPHDNVEIILVDNGSDEPASLTYIKNLERAGRVRVLRYGGEFNFSAINNFAAKSATGDIICFLNNDTEVVERDWLNYARALLSISDVGIVGARLLYPDGTLQHFGVVTGVGSHRVAAHLHHGLDGEDAGYFGKARLIQQFGAVTAACMFISKALFTEVGGFEEELAVAYNDVDLCLKVRGAGYRVVGCPEILLTHKESRTRGLDKKGRRAARLKAEAKWVRERWGDGLATDPLYSPNLSLERSDYKLADAPRVPLPWRIQ